MPSNKNKRKPLAFKSCEATVAGLMSRMLGLPKMTTVMDVVSLYLDAEGSDALSQAMRFTDSFYAWKLNVAGQIMGNSSADLVSELVAQVGRIIVVQDVATSGYDSVWMVVAEPEESLLALLRGMPVRGLFHTFKIEDDTVHVVGFQLASCL